MPEGLRFVGLKPKTLKCYEKALMAFFHFLEEEEIPVPSKRTKLDQLLAQFLEHLYLDDRPITYAGHTMSAFRRFFPQLRYKLPLAKQFFSNWRNVHVSHQAVPLPAPVVLGIAGVAVECKQLGFACLVLVGFLGFLRTSEMTNLQWSKISFNVSTGQIILALPATKTSKNKEESIVLHDLKVCYLLQKLKLNSNSIYLWEGSASVFRRQLKEILAFLRLEEDAFSAYSIRRGGATHAFSEGVPMDQLVIKGRWQNAKTARIYLDSGRAALVQLRFSAHSSHLLASATASLSTFLYAYSRGRTA